MEALLWRVGQTERGMEKSRSEMLTSPLSSSTRMATSSGGGRWSLSASNDAQNLAEYHRLFSSDTEQ